jgi:6-phosphogluconolactonase
MRPPSPLWSIPAAAALTLLLLVPAAATAHATNAPGSGPAPEVGGAVFTMSNAVAGNVVIAYTIGSGGSLSPAGSFHTGGTGTGASLADQGALTLTQDHRFLFVVNAGDNTVSVFSVHYPAASGRILTLDDVAGAQGVQPVSVTVHGAFVYVLDAGNATAPGNIAGFFLTPSGQLVPIPGSVQPLSAASPTGPAEIAFNPAGTVLAVTEEDTSLIDTYPLSVWGAAQLPVVTPSNGSTPYGFAFSEQGALIVSDAGSGALSSYAVAQNGRLTVVSGSVGDGQLAPCWVAIYGPYAFTTNAHSSTISTYQVGGRGTLSLLSAVAASTGAADTDMAIGGPHGQYLLVYDAGAGEIQDFAIGGGGSLSPAHDVGSLPATAEGLAAF